MAFALVLIGLLFVITGAQGTQKEFGEQLYKDFTGPGNFTFWILSLGAVGALGYIKEFRTFSRLFMALIIISMIVANQGFFARLTEAIESGTVEKQAQ